MSLPNSATLRNDLGPTASQAEDDSPFEDFYRAWYARIADAQWEQDGRALWDRNADVILFL